MHTADDKVCDIWQKNVDGFGYGSCGRDVWMDHGVTQKGTEDCIKVVCCWREGMNSKVLLEEGKRPKEKESRANLIQEDRRERLEMGKEHRKRRKGKCLWRRRHRGKRRNRRSVGHSCSGRVTKRRAYLRMVNGKIIMGGRGSRKCREIPEGLGGRSDGDH